MTQLTALALQQGALLLPATLPLDLHQMLHHHLGCRNPGCQHPVARATADLNDSGLVVQFPNQLLVVVPRWMVEVVKVKNDISPTTLVPTRSGHDPMALRILIALKLCTWLPGWPMTGRTCPKGAYASSIRPLG